MRYIAIVILLGVTLKVNAQQINPVPDYIFRNQMSVGRNAATDTAAYMSIGPRYGAVKGFMPPMVVDTNAVTGTKRNGLLIFSVQLNNFAYWDSTTSRFRKITADAVVDSLVFSTRAWRQKGDDSLGAVIAVKTDTALLSTKAYRQKGVDSLVTLISTLGGGTVLSVGSGYGTNFSTITTSGNVVVDSLVITSRASRDKLKDSLNANIALKVNISDTSTMLGAYLRKADTTSMLSPYLRKGDTTAMLSPYVRTAGYGLTKGTQTLSVDSALMATRARVQKGIDSVASLVAAPDSLLFSTRAWRQKGDDSLGAIIGTKATATGTTNYLSKFTGTSSLGNSIVYATTSEVGISTPSPTHPLDVNGRVRVRTIDSTASPINFLTTDNDGVIRKTTPFTGTVSSVATGFGLSGGTITTAGTLVADTNSIATRARVQKAVDSLNVNIAAKGSGTVTSVSAGTGMSFTTITTTGSVSADTTVLSTRAWRQKGVDSVANLSRIGGSGTINRVPKFTASGTIGDGSISDSSSSVRMTILSGGNIGVATAAPAYNFDISGSLRNTTNAFFNTSSGESYFGTTNDIGDHRLQVAGSIYSTTGGLLAATSGNVQIGSVTTSSNYILRGGRSVTTVGDNVINTVAHFSNTNDNNTNGTTSYPVLSLERVGVSGISNNSLFEIGLSRYSTANTNAFTQADFIVRDGNSNSRSTVATFSNSQITLRTADTDHMRLTSAGNLGIGTTSPTYKLDVSGDFRNTTGAALATSSGNVGIGRTSTSHKLDVAGAIKSDSSVLIRGRKVSTGLNGAMELGYEPSNRGAVISVLNRDVSPVTYGNLYFEADSIVHNRFGIFSMVMDKNFLLTRGDFSIFMDSTADALGINTTSPTNTLDVNGRARVRTIDSTANAINMLYADANGVIKKTAVPASSVTMSTDEMTAASGWTIAYDKTQAYPVNDVNKTVDGSIATVTINTAAYRTTATFNTDQWVHVATVPSGFRPNSDVYFSLPNTVAGASFRSTSSVAFTSYNFYQEETAIRVLPSGNVEVYVGLVSNSADLSGSNYVIMPIAVTYNIETYPN